MSNEARPGHASSCSDGALDPAVLDELKRRWQADPKSVHDSWAAHFEGRDPAPVALPDGVADGSLASPQMAERYARVLRLIHSFRARGHRIAHTDPLSQTRASYFPELDPAHYGLGDDDLDREFFAGDLPGGPIQTLRAILERLRATYCGTCGIEFTHIQDPGRRQWLMRRMEEARNETVFSAREKKWILERVEAAELFERFLHTKFLGQKRFSLEGAEALIPLLDAIVEGAPDRGVRELVIGMAHRGRLNVLSNILGKSLESIFSEFEDMELDESPFGSGDVKYHKGYSNDRRTRSGERVHLTLTANPSHLEAVDPVVVGRCRAKQVRSGDPRGMHTVPVIVHGDAAFAGQGMVSEVLNLSHLVGYSTGGTIHVVVNNQIGFTTTPQEARSTLYATDVAKMIQVPIFHVNGDDPEAVVHCVNLAFSYRQRFGDDVVIDMVCYRRHGHNEGDEPAFTQPILYSKIRSMEGLRKQYAERLVNDGSLSREEVMRLQEDLQAQLQQALEVIKTKPPAPDEPYEPRGPWTGYSRVDGGEDVDTGVPRERLAQISEAIASVPPDFTVHPKLQILLDKRRKVVADGGPIDWATAEALAFGSLLVEGTPVRLSGQDSSRGTFNQRHAVLVDQQTGSEFAPLDHISETQARFEVYDSHLSEAAVLGFEYGYSLADPTTLTLWEAQFGDFANGAQVIIDQFITSAHVKWKRMSGLVMLLPHGYEGQGPEHSSCRIERFLQLCAEDNMQVANCTTPAQFFHLLRRQMRRSFRAPLVVATPKSLLRAPFATSTTECLESGRFEPVIDDATIEAPERVRRVLLCTGKVYYDLVAHREKRETKDDVAIVRVEQLYPWPEPSLAHLMERYGNAERVTWVQEEPANMGAWTFVSTRIQSVIPGGAQTAYAGRPASASPAVGSLRIHRHEQTALVVAAFQGLA
ncbi:MAG: 2-oxoglutarate dehydrogenase E1 component [Myxococcota bacterium]|nr:2-oxoglutarate dehydrogenase E1 component [Myxococcota bacterium]